jgi:hypothetical protein
MPRLYGFDNQSLTRLRDDEVPVVRDMANRAEAGQSQAEIAAWENSEGHRGTMGGEWTSMSVGRLLDNPAIAGLERDPSTGELRETGLPAIISRAQFERLQKRPSRLGSVRSGVEREPDYDYLLNAGTVVCGLCTVPLTGARSDAGTPSYRCPTNFEGQKGCGKVRITASPLEDYVGEYIVAELLRPEVANKLEEARRAFASEAEGVRERISQLEKARADLAQPYAKGELSRAAYLAADKETTAGLKAQRSRLRSLEQVMDVPVRGVDDLVSWWNHAPIRSRRALVALLLERVEVFSAPARGVRTVEGRVQLHWRAKQHAVAVSPGADPGK